jgi:hypothetical protein
MAKISGYNTAECHARAPKRTVLYDIEEYGQEPRRRAFYTPSCSLMDSLTMRSYSCDGSVSVPGPRKEGGTKASRGKKGVGEEMRTA